MSSDGKKIAGVKAININEESAEAIEKMVDKAIQQVRGEGFEILEIQTSSDYLIMILGKGWPANDAGVAQWVECQLPKLNVAGSNPTSRSLN